MMRNREPISFLGRLGYERQGPKVMVTARLCSRGPTEEVQTPMVCSEICAFPPVDLFMKSITVTSQAS